jgi:fructosamine-3-kinase
MCRDRFSSHTQDVPPFVKRNSNAPREFFGCEAAGLQWLSQARGGARCVAVIAHDDTSLTLERLHSSAPTSEAAEEFGRALARTHDAGADGWGARPNNWIGPGYFGPLEQPLPMSYQTHDTWGVFYAEERLYPMAERARPALSAQALDVIEVLITRCRAGDFDDGDAPSRLHGDLWSGNVMWTRDGVVLIDPAAHGGHRETDLAMLNLFGCPHLEAIIEGYQQVHPLRAGWRERIPLHQLYPLLAHVALFGAGYANQTRVAARKALEV